MKRFDQEAIKNRLIDRLRVKEEWVMLVEDGTIYNIIDVVSEGLAENARYLEYLLNEKKYLTAQNISSLTHMGALISRKQERAKSATGFVIVSHTDETGKNRMSNFGKTFFEIDSPSDYDDIDRKLDVSYSETTSLVPWTYSATYKVPQFTRFIATNGTEFISTKDVTIRRLTEPYSTISSNAESKEAFERAGGWNGIKYLKVPVIQGALKKVRLGVSDGSRFQSFVINSPMVEAAKNSISRPLFKITIELENGVKEQWSEVRNIRMAEPYDKVFETKLLDDNSGVLVKFGDGVTGLRVPKSSIVFCDYLETKGESGNINNKYQITSIRFPNGIDMIDPRTGLVSSFLSCTNIYPLTGGKDIEDEDDFRTMAPISYLDSYTTAVAKEYEAKIMKESPIALMHCITSSQNDISEITVDELNDSKNIINNITISKNVLKVSAIDSTGNVIEDAQESFINPLIYAMSDIKSPNDTFKYEIPNMIELGIDVKVLPNNYDITVSQIAADIKAAILSEYSIQNVNFKNNFYKSNITNLTHLFEYTKACKVNVNALAIEDLNNIYYSKANSMHEDYISIPFRFPVNYGINKVKSPFKSYKDNAFYLLKIDMIFKNLAKTDNKNKTLFVIDKRNVNYTDFNNAKKTVLSAGVYKELSPTVFDIEKIECEIYNESSNEFHNRLVHIIQYPYIESITDDDYMIKVLDKKSFPYEIRPYEVDSVSGEFKIYESYDVDEELRKFIAGSTSSCYKIDKRFVSGIDIIFNENYSKNDETFANGYLSLPLSMFGFDTALAGVNEYNIKERISLLLKEYIDIRISAQCVFDDIASVNWNDIIFTSDTNIKVETMPELKTY